MTRFFDRLGSKGVAAMVAALLSLAVLGWLATGFYTVGPSEQAALRLFGEFRGFEGPGSNWYPPAPIGTRNVEAVLETRTMELGIRSNLNIPVPVEAEMITGDLSIVDVNLVVQYRIKDLSAFLFNVDDPGDPDRPESRPGVPDGRTLKDATEAAVRFVIGQRSLDDLLTLAKTEVQDATARLLQETLDDYGAGIEVLAVVLTEVRPPNVVRDAFDDVNRARIDRETRINQALAYREEQIANARSEGQ